MNFRIDQFRNGGRGNEGAAATVVGGCLRRLPNSSERQREKENMPLTSRRHINKFFLLLYTAASTSQCTRSVAEREEKNLFSVEHLRYSLSLIKRPLLLAHTGMAHTHTRTWTENGESEERANETSKKHIKVHLI
jgi:hypothetical protein